MAATRRLGAESSESRGALMDAVEAVMREHGYAALTARRVGERAGLNYQLVFYYFGAMDDLLLATYRRHIDRHRSAIEQALQSDRPLRAYWSVFSNPRDAVLNVEFMAMSNHNARVRAETIRISEDVRAFHIDHLGPRIAALAAGDATITPAAVMMALNYIGSLLGLESALGVTGAHDDMRAMVEWWLDRLEPANAGPAPSL